QESCEPARPIARERKLPRFHRLNSVALDRPVLNRVVPVGAADVCTRPGVSCHMKRWGAAPTGRVSTYPLDDPLADLSSNRRPARQYLPCTGDGSCGRLHLRHVWNRRRAFYDAAADFYRYFPRSCGGDVLKPHRGIFFHRRDKLLAQARARRRAGDDAAERRYRRHGDRRLAIYRVARTRSARPRDWARLRHTAHRGRRYDDLRKRAGGVAHAARCPRDIAAPRQPYLDPRPAIQAAV